MPKEIFDCPVDRIVRVVDGDTQHLLLDRGWSSFQGITTRIESIDAPENNTTAGKLVTVVVRMWLERVAQVKYRLRWISRDLDMYGRSLGDYRDREHLAESLGEYLIAKQLAKPFAGKRAPWKAEELKIAADVAQTIIGD